MTDEGSTQILTLLTPSMPHAQMRHQFETYKFKVTRNKWKYFLKLLSFTASNGLTSLFIFSIATG